jgi:hypothetical protein
MTEPIFLDLFFADRRVGFYARRRDSGNGLVQSSRICFVRGANMPNARANWRFPSVGAKRDMQESVPHRPDQA